MYVCIVYLFVYVFMHFIIYVCLSLFPYVLSYFFIYVCLSLFSLFMYFIPLVRSFFLSSGLLSFVS